jgi:hypothetical protein
MIRACDLRDWIVADETGEAPPQSRVAPNIQPAWRGAWTVRERLQYLNSGEPPVLLIASGTEENCKLIAAAVPFARFLAELVRSDDHNPVRVKMKAQALLVIAGIEP